MIRVRRIRSRGVDVNAHHIVCRHDCGQKLRRRGVSAAVRNARYHVTQTIAASFRDLATARTCPCALIGNRSGTGRCKIIFSPVHGEVPCKSWGANDTGRTSGARPDSTSSAKLASIGTLYLNIKPS
ncbi:hypothetical protein Taro_016901 [Colocasia esculenta]|uniref:Uncharacterized protein n=1 Tax=Colocasia esculenta TaxID=4460 RepID=A0A843UEX7_COLES|nr:hypothetical protein [Colocasia esculenta]